MPSILSELTRRNPDVDSSRTRGGANTRVDDWPGVDSWTLWKDFNAKHLYGLYKDVVDAEWRDPPTITKITRFDSQIFDEDSLEHNVLSKTLFPPINAALRSARKTLHLNYSFDLDLARGGRCYYNPSGDKRYYPDWSLCSENRPTEGFTYLNLFPGDTKLASKWHSSMFPSVFNEWVDPVRQILNYCDRLGVRYGFLITDLELVVFRFLREEIGSGISRTRPTRARPQQPPSGRGYRVASGSTDISKLSDSLQNTSLGGSSYQATDSSAEYHPVEYQAVPWTNYGDGKKTLTVRLALFYLSMMAGYGPATIQTAYPPFNSWTCRDDGTLMHNTSGKVVKRTASPDAILCYHDPAASGPSWVTMDDGMDYLTRASIATLEVDRQRNQYYYVDENGNSVYITEDMPVYDEDSGEFGRLSGLVWKGFEEAGEAGESSRKRRKK